MKAAYPVLFAVVVSLGLAERVAASTEKPAVVLGHTWGRNRVNPPGPTVEFRVFHDGRVELFVSSNRHTLQSRLTREAAATFIQQASAERIQADMTTLQATVKPACRKCEVMFVRFPDRQYRFAAYIQTRDAKHAVTQMNPWINVPDVESLVESGEFPHGRRLPRDDVPQARAQAGKRNFTCCGYRNDQRFELFESSRSCSLRGCVSPTSLKARPVPDLLCR